ncbi:calpastatin [Pelodytes ibericus]
MQLTTRQSPSAVGVTGDPAEVECPLDGGLLLTITITLQQKSGRSVLQTCLSQAKGGSTQALARAPKRLVTISTRYNSAESQSIMYQLLKPNQIFPLMTNVMLLLLAFIVFKQCNSCISDNSGKCSLFQHGDKKTTGASKPADKKAPEAEALPSQGKTMNPADPKAPPSQEKTVKTADPKAQPSQEKPVKPADPKVKQTEKPEPPKSTQSTKPKSTSTTPSVATSKSSTGKHPSKQEPKTVPGKGKVESKVSSGLGGKVVAGAVAGTVVAAGVAAAAVESSKPKDEGKEKKAVSVDKVSAAPAPAKSEVDDALDLLIGTLEGPDDVPESPKFTGPEITETPTTSEYLEELGKREHTIPPDYRHLLDGKGDKPAPENKEETLGDDDLLDALSSDFVSCQAPPEEKKPKLEETAAVKPTSAAAVASAPESEAVPEEAIDILLGTLDAPEVNVPESPQYTGPEVTETITSSYLEELGKREPTIPPEYRKLLDGKDHGKEIPPPVPAVQSPVMTDAELADAFSNDFVSSSPTFLEPNVPIKPNVAKQDKQSKPDEVVSSCASSVQSSAAHSDDVDSALDELMGTLEGPEFTVPESPVYTGPEVTEISTAIHVEELGKRESTIPPAYRNLLDGKEDGKPVPPPPKEVPMDDNDLADAFDKDFACPQPPTVQQTSPVKPKDSSSDKKATETDLVVSSSVSAVQAALAPSKVPVQKASAPKGDPLDALSSTLGVQQEDPKDKKPPSDPVKETTGKGKKDKLGEDEKTIPPDYRLQEVKDKDGKPILPKPEEKPKAMSEDELLDALDFVTSPATLKSAPLQCSAKEAKSPSGSEDVISASKVSTVKAGAPQPAAPDAEIPDDALDLLSGSLGTREVDPDENKPIVDVVKEKAKSEHIEKLGERDDTIPPEYRHLLDGKDEKGQPIKPPLKEDVKPEKPLGDDAAIDALSSGFESCDTSSKEKAQQSSKEKTEKGSSTVSSKPSGRTSESAKAEAVADLNKLIAS